MKMQRPIHFDGKKAKHQIEIGLDERISIQIQDKAGKSEEHIGYFMPGVLTLDWERDTKLQGPPN